MGALTSIRSAGMTALRRVRSAAGGTAVVLTYHRIVVDPLDPEGLAIPPSRFEEHVAAFAERYRLITAGELFGLIAQKRRIPARSLVITIDDGYADCATQAYPILKRHDAPATVFVSSGFIDGEREFWWDELEKLFLLVDEPREDLYLKFNKMLGPLSCEDRESLLSQLRADAGVVASVRESKRALTRGEVALLACEGLVEVGAHTVSHQALASRTPQEQRREIFGCKETLEEICGFPPVSFSYPYGRAGTFTEETVALVREAGFLGACTTQLGAPIPWGSASRSTDPYRVPRTATGDVPVSEMVALIDKRLGL